MNRLRKRYFLPLCGLAGALILLAATLVFLPRLFSSDSARLLIESKVSALTGAQIRYRKAELNFIPWPRLIFQHSSIEIENRFSGKADLIVVVPRLLPLLMGKIRIGAISADQGHFRIDLPPKEKTGLKTFPPPNALAGVLSGILSNISQVTQEDITFRLKNGQIELFKETRPVFGFNDISGEMHLSPRQVFLKFSEQSKEAGRLAFGFDLDPESFAGSAYLQLQHYSPDKALALLYPDNHIKTDGTGVQLKCNFLFKNAETFSGTIEGALSDLSYLKEKEVISFHNGKVKSTIAVSPKRTEWQISRLSLLHPRLSLTARYINDNIASNYQWNINAKDLDLENTGKTACALAPNARVIQTVFRILQAGTIRSIQLEDKAASPDDLKKAAGLKIRGFIEEGTVFIPKPDLTLTHATGWVTVADGVLKGNNLSAQLGNTKGLGSYSMTLGSKKPPFFLDAEVEADASELPPLLHRLVKNETFKKEMTRISAAKGHATGRLVINNSESGFAVTVNVSRFDLSGQYDRIPYPIHILDGGFHLDADRISIENMRGRIGNTPFSGLTAHIGRKTPFPLEVQASGLQAQMDEVFPWLQQYNAIAAKLTAFTAVTGTIHAAEVSLKGPALLPSDWQFVFAGKLENLEILTPRFPSPVQFQDGIFTVIPGIITLEQAHITAMDTLAETRITVSRYLTPSPDVEATLRGVMGPKTADWVKAQMKIPVFLTWSKPRFVAPLFLKWSAPAGLALSGNLQTPGGPSVGIRLKKRRGIFSLEKLTLLDDLSNAALSFKIDEQFIDLSFSGHLHHRTVDALVAENSLLSGRIEGKCRTRFNRSSPHLSTFTGRLRVEALDLRNLKLPLVVERASLSGNEHDLHIFQGQLEWKQQPLLLDGDIRQDRDGLNLDLTLATEELSWPRLLDIVKPPKNPRARQFPLFGQIQAHIGNLICTPTLAFQPLDAQVSFKGKETDIAVSRAMLCGIPLSGAITKTPNAYRIEARPSAKDSDLALALACLSRNEKNISGIFQLDGKVVAAANAGTPIPTALAGQMAFAAEKGRIHRFGLAAKILTLLNVAGLFKGELPDMEKEGFPYKTAGAKMIFDKGLLHITEGIIDSSAMKIFFQGEENLTARTHDLSIVVAPLKTVDLLVSHIPLVRDILDKGLVIYPIKVSGTWENPELNLLSPDSVGKEIWGIIIRTLKLPFKILEPLFPEE